MKNTILILFIIFFGSCNHKSAISINSIEDFKKYKKEFCIISIEQLGQHNSILELYAINCNLQYSKDSVLKEQFYEVDFSDSTNTSIEILQFTSVNYADYLNGEIKPLVKAAREINSRKKSNENCNSYYLSRIYNYSQKGNTIYLFSFDGYNISGGNIDSIKLRNLDGVCKALVSG